MKTANQKRYISTMELVGKLHAEPKEVKASVGGTKSFRSIMDFVSANSMYQDEDKCQVVKRKASELASMIESTFPKEEIEAVKSLYSL